MYNQIKEFIKQKIKEKLNKYRPESKSMPFHYKLLGKDRMFLYSFIQSLNTTFGTSIFEPVAVILAQKNFDIVIKQYSLPREISVNAQNKIQQIIDTLSIGETPSWNKEFDLIYKSATIPPFTLSRSTKADIFLKKGNTVFLLDLKTAKPNINEFKSYKRTLLEWTAKFLYKNQKFKVKSIIAIPYNPYEPKPYERWTLKGMLDLKNELMVGDEFWNFLGGEGTYERLLDTFEQAGIELREVLDNFFAKFKN